ncbi:MAG: dihydroorotate dehydrogenase electron transfer subunit [Hungatella sp.]
MAEIKQIAEIESQQQLLSDVYSMWIAGEQIAVTAKPGQFLSLYPKDASKLLPRPISICEVDKKAGRIRLVYRVVGGGTEEFSGYRAGDEITVMGPLGNGFPMDFPDKKAFLIGGGIGIPPMLELAKQLKCEKQMILGYRDQLFLREEFEAYGKVYLATEDGSSGTKGNVLDAISEHHLSADVIFACGPTPMLRAIKAYAKEHRIECYLSLEEKMACGIGACLACVCQSMEIDAHSRVHNKRIC